MIMSVQLHLQTVNEAPIPLHVDIAQKVYPSQKDILMVAFPVGSLWATQDEDADPAVVLDFGTWEKVSPGRMTWRMLMQSRWNSEGTVLGYYIWHRTA